jgi:RNA polymerase primary sigma factor
VLHNGVVVTEQTEVDPAKAARVTRLAEAHAMDDRVTVGNLTSVFELTQAGPLMQDSVKRALEERGIQVVDEPDMWSQNSQAGAPPLADGLDPIPARVTPAEAEAAMSAARQVLAADTRTTKPWMRLLSAQQEVGLALLMRNGRIPLAAELPRRYRSSLVPDDEPARAFDALYLHNLRLVHSVALTRPPQVGMDLDDLTQSGMVGLIRAVEKFDATTGNKFSTYAMWWIRQSISRAVADEALTIRIPVHMVEKINKVRAARTRLTSKTGEAPLAGLCSATGYSAAEVIECLRLARGIISLDAPLIDNLGGTIGEVLSTPAGQGTDPEEVLDRAQLTTLVRQALATLTPREAMVLSCRAGIDREEPMTLDAIGAELGVTRERIRQIEGKARPKLVQALAELGLIGADGSA